MLKTRIITAFVLIFGFLVALFNASDNVWSLMTLGITLIGVWEWSNLIKLNKVQMMSLITIALGIAMFFFFLPTPPLALYQHQFIQLLLGSATIFWVLVAPFWLVTRKTFSNKLIMCALGLLLLLATWVGLIGLHHISPWLLLSVIATVSIADSAAYFSGKRYGRHKLASEISPGKTWEGVAGAIVAVTLYGAILCYYQGYNKWMIVGFWLIVVFSIMGDLFESLLKRQAGVKDSSQLLPGHGGVLDRIDGLIPTLAIALFSTYIPLFFKFQIHA